MYNFLSLLPVDGWQRLMMDAAWQTTLVGALGWVGARLLSCQAAARAWLLLVTLTACLLVPLASISARSAGWTVFRPASARADQLPTLARHSLISVSPTEFARSESAPIERPRKLFAAGRDSSVVSYLTGSRSLTPANLCVAIGIIWVLTSVFLLGRLILSLGVVWRLVQRAAPCSKARLVAAAAEASRRVGLHNPPRLLVSDAVSTPMVLAVMRPTLLLPATHLGDSTEIEWTAAFAHELAHVVRRDGWCRLWVQMVTITLPLQPLVWLLRRSFYAACEEACDDWAVASGSDPVDLATALTAWVNHSGHRQVLVAIGMSSTKARTLRLLALRAKPVAHLTFRWRWCSVAAAIVVVAGLAIAQSPNDERLHERAPAPDVIESTNTAQPTKPEEVSSEQNVTTYSDEFTISGACVDENKKPLADVDVRLFVLDYANLQLNSGRSDNMQRELQTTRTDASGRFEFSDVDPQQAPNRPFALVVIALSPGKATAMRLLSPAPAREQTIELTLLSATTLQGRVTTESGTPVAGAVVSVGCGLLNPVPGLCAAVTDNDGRYLISDLRPFDIAAQKPQPTGDGGYDMISGCFAEVRHPDYARERFTYTRLPSSVDVTIRRAAVVEGQIVLDENGEPAVGAIVEIYNDTVGPANWTRTKTDTNGHYRLEMLPPGTYRLSAALKGRPNLFRKEVSLTSGHNQLNLRMEKGGVVKGRVVDNTTGKPIELGPNETMSISPHEPRGAWYQGMPSAQIQRDGTFTLLLPAGRNYLAMYFGKNWRGVNTDKLSRDGIDVSKGRSVDLEIRVTPRTPDDDRPPKPLSPKQAAQLAERAAIAAIKQLGGWVTTEQIDGEEHVVEVNMVYHEDELRGRQENRLLSDECLSYVRKFTKLKKLLLTGEQATDAALANLSGMQSLETVMIWDASAITDAGVAHLATLPNLKLVHISNAQITDEALRYFSGVPDLERISLQGNHFTDDGLAYIKDMTQLKALILGLGRNEITDDGLRFLTRLTNLERLDLQQSTVSDAGLQHLRHLKRLNSLWLGGTAVTNAGLDELHWSLPKLQKGEAIQY